MRQKLLSLTSGILFCFSGVNAQMSGNYTISINPSADFSSISAAINQLASQGMAGPVNLFLGDTLYNEQVVIPYIPGVSATNILTIEPSDTLPVSRAVIADSATGFSDNYVFLLDSTRFITLRNLEVRTKSPDYGTCVLADSGCANITIDSSKFISQLLYAGNVLFINDPGSHHITISNSVFQYGGIGISLQGFNGINITNLNIVHNVFLNNSLGGIYAAKIDSANFSANNFQTTNTSDFYKGIQFNNAYTYSILNNTFLLWSGTAIYSGYSGVLNNATMANNVISVRGYLNMSTDYGIVIQNGYDQHIFYNTIVIGDSSSKKSADISFPSAAGAGTSNTILNNDLVNNSGGRVLKILDSDPILVDSIDYNNLYTSGDTLVEKYDSVFLDLASWSASSGFDQHSISYNPMLSDSVFNAGCLSKLDSAALPVFIKTDYKGVKRDTSYPDIGAYENIMPVINLGADTLSICQGQRMTLTTGDSGQFSYSWSNGSHTKNIEISSQGKYTVTVTGNRNCSAIDSMYLIVNNCSSDLDIVNNKSNLTLSPNPFSQYFSIDRNADGPSKITVFNMQGNVVYSGESNVSHININGTKWLSGIYLVRITEEKKQYYLKVIRR